MSGNGKSGPALLTSQQLSTRLQQLKGWRVEDGGKKLAKSFRFKNFVEAVNFVNAITREAEAAGHHPDLFVTWGEVRVYLTSHSAGGVTEKDFALAARIDRI